MKKFIKNYVQLIGLILFLANGICYITIATDYDLKMVSTTIIEFYKGNIALFAYNIFSTLVTLVSFVLMLHKEKEEEAPHEPEQAQEPSIIINVIGRQQDI
jgi:hypothetical protein